MISNVQIYSTLAPLCLYRSSSIPFFILLLDCESCPRIDVCVALGCSCSRRSQMFIVICVPVCLSLVNVVLVVFGPLLAMTGDVDMRLEIFVCSVRVLRFCCCCCVCCSRHIISTLVKCFCLLLLSSLLCLSFGF